MILVTLALSSPVLAQTSSFDGFLTLRGINASGPLTWLERGDGRMDASGGTGSGIAQVGGDWAPSDHFAVHAQLLGRMEPSRESASHAGVVEAYVEASGGGWQIRAGQFFLPTSRENIAPLWTSPYTLSLSAFNSWIAQEFRPIGVDLQWKGEHLTLAGTAFRGNDTSGTLLGWRGWTIGNRVSVLGETLPLPPLPPFPSQKNGTEAFGRDLDGRTGFAERIRWSVPSRALIQFAHSDNRGDRELYHGQYSWRTRFDVLSVEGGSADGTKFVAEFAKGDTGMGFPPAAFVQADISSGYFLVSQKVGTARISGRYDVFSMIDRDHSIGGNTTEHGRAWVLAWLIDLSPHVRAGAEFAQVTGHRNASFDGRSVIVELRYALR